MSGVHRLCVTTEDVMFFPVGSDTPMAFKIISLRSCLCNDTSFQLHTGRSSLSGAGILDIHCDDANISADLNAAVLDAMEKNRLNPETAKLSTSLQQRTKKIKEREAAAASKEGGGSSRSSSREQHRPRSESCSEIDKKTAVVSRPPHLPHSSAQHHQRHATIVGPGPPASLSGGGRYRTTSEGHSMDPMRRRLAGANKSGSLVSSSPLSPSPGSYVSSESAGSSNSLDEADMLMAPERRHGEIIMANIMSLQHHILISLNSGQRPSNGHHIRGELGRIVRRPQQPALQVQRQRGGKRQQRGHSQGGQLLERRHGPRSGGSLENSFRLRALHASGGLHLSAASTSYLRRSGVTRWRRRYLLLTGQSGSWPSAGLHGHDPRIIRLIVFTKIRLARPARRSGLLGGRRTSAASHAGSAQSRRVFLVQPGDDEWLASHHCGQSQQPNELPQPTGGRGFTEQRGRGRLRGHVARGQPPCVLVDRRHAPEQEQRRRQPFRVYGHESNKRVQAFTASARIHRLRREALLLVGRPKALLRQLRGDEPG